MRFRFKTHFGSEERHKARQEQSGPVLDAYLSWLKRMKTRTLPRA